MNAPLQTSGVNDVWSYREIHLDSSARDGGSNESPVFSLSVPLHDVLAFQVLRVHVPHGYSTVNSRNDKVSIGINVNDYGAVPPTAVVARIPHGVYKDPLSLAQAVASLYDRILQPHWPGRFRMNASQDSQGRISLSLVDRTTGAFVPPDPNAVYQFSLYIQGYRKDSGETLPTDTFAFDVQSALGTPDRFWFNQPNVWTAPQPGLFSRPFRLGIASNLTGYIPDRLLLRPNSLLCTLPHSSDRGHGLSLSASQTDMLFGTGLAFLQHLRFDLLHIAEPWSAVPVDLRGRPWTISLAVLTQRQHVARHEIKRKKQ